MPRYRYRCGIDGDVEIELKVRDVHKPVYCQTCGMLMVRVFVMPNVSATAQPNRRADTAAQVESERQLGRDRDAYKRLRRNGLQPKTLTGAAHLERHAETKHEVEMGRIMPTKLVREVVDLAQHVVQKDLEV